MQFDYTLKQEGQNYILEIAGIGQKRITDVSTVHEQAKLYIEAALNLPVNQIKLNYVSAIDDRIVSSRTPNKAQ